MIRALDGTHSFDRMVWGRVLVFITRICIYAFVRARQGRISRPGMGGTDWWSLRGCPRRPLPRPGRLTSSPHLDRRWCLGGIILNSELLSTRLCPPRQRHSHIDDYPKPLLPSGKLFSNIMLPQCLMSLTKHHHNITTTTLQSQNVAYANLGLSYSGVGAPVLSAESTANAWRLRARASDRERFFIDFAYDRQVTGNLEKAYQTLESWLRTYPRGDEPPSPYDLVTVSLLQVMVLLQ